MATPENPELVPGGLDVSKLTDNAAEVITATADRFTDVIQQLLTHLSWENVLLQLLAVFVSVGLGFWLSRRVNRLIDKWSPEPTERGMAAYCRRFVVGFTHNVSFSLLAGSILPWLSTLLLKQQTILGNRWSLPVLPTTSSMPMLCFLCSWRFCMVAWGYA